MAHQEPSHAELTGWVYVATNVRIEARVSVTDGGRGTHGVVVKWPLVTLRFTSLADVRKALAPFSQLADVDKDIKSLVDECLDELGA
jgi:hypothetical protein